MKYFGVSIWKPSKIPVILGSDITSEACAAKLYYLLARRLNAAVIKRALESSLRGEANLPARGLVDGKISDMSTKDRPPADPGQRRYLREGEELESELRAKLEAAWPGQVSVEPRLGDTRVDILVTINSNTVGFECSATILDRARAASFLDRLRRSGVNRMIVVAQDFLPSAKQLIDGSGGHALTWLQAHETNWLSFLSDL